MLRFPALLVALTVALSGHAITQGALPPIRLTLRHRTSPEIANFGNVGAAVITKDGGIAITDYDLHGIRFFSATGVAAGTFGRSGEGPGEFRNINAIGLIGDSMWVFDYGTRRLTLVALDHKLIRTVLAPVLQLRGREKGVTLDFGGVRAVYSDRSIALKMAFARGSAQPLWADGRSTHASPTLRVTADGALRYVISWETAGDDCSVAYSAPNLVGAITVPFCETSLVGNTADGSLFVSVIMAPGAKEVRSYHVIATSARGDTLYSRDFGFTPLPIPTHLADSVLKRRRDGARWNALATRAAAQVRVPYAYPPLRAIVVGADSTVWLEQWTDATTHRWIAIAPTGKQVGAVELPNNARLIAADHRAFWVTEINDDDISGLASFTITWPRE